MLTPKLLRLGPALCFLSALVPASLLAQGSEDRSSVGSRVESLRSEVLAALPDIDREIEAILARGRAACETPWADARLNRAVDPYSLALHQEGRSREDATAAAMRNTQKGVAYFRRLNGELLKRWEGVEKDFGLARVRLVSALRELEELELEEGAPSARAREALAAELGELSSALQATRAAVARSSQIVNEHREEWLELVGQANAADPKGADLRPRTREKGELMLVEFRAMDRSLLALAGSTDKHLTNLLLTIAPLAEQVDDLREDVRRVSS